MYNRNQIQSSKDPYRNINYDRNDIKNLYYGEVVSVDDETDGGRIKVKILGLDNKIIDNNELPYSYPLLPKFFHVYPKIGEIVRVFIEDKSTPQRGRFWIGSVISQLHKIEFDSIYTALSTTNMGYTIPERAPSTYPDAEGVFPKRDDIAIIGRVNTDVILSENKVELRAGKHENDNVLKLNTKNPASISLNFDQMQDQDDYYSNNIIMADKIALISHSGVPKFKSARINENDRTKIFNEGHPIARADILVEILNLFRRAIINHIHGYSSLPADKNSIIKDLEKINIESIIQENIVIN